MNISRQRGRAWFSSTRMRLHANWPTRPFLERNSIFAQGVKCSHELTGSLIVDTEFMFETTLASLSYARKIPAWEACGYTVALIYLRLPNVELSIDRVRRRVAAGGHDVPERVIRQRFVKSAKYLESLYKPIVDEWYIWDSLEGEFQLAEAWDD